MKLGWRYDFAQCIAIHNLTIGMRVFTLWLCLIHDKVEVGLREPTR